MTRQDAARIVDLLREAYPNVKSLRSPNAAAAWFVFLEHVSYDEVRAAVIDMVRSGGNIPTPADVAKRFPAAASGSGAASLPPRRSVSYEEFLRMASYLPPEEAEPIIAKVQAERKRAGLE